MNRTLMDWSAKFAVLKDREKQLIAAASVAIIGLVGFTIWVEPPMVKEKNLVKQVAQQKAEIAKLQSEAANLRLQVADPDAQVRAALAEVRGRIAKVESGLREYDKALVRPEQMTGLLKSLLSRHRNLQLVSLQNLPPAPLIAPAKPDAKAPVAPEGKNPPPVVAGNIYKHGIELTLSGSYQDLLSYVAELEKSPERLIWDKMSLKTLTYPSNELSLRLYTLSLDDKWLVL